MSPRDRPLGILLLGCGQAADIHSRTLRRIGSTTLWYASRDRERAERYCGRYGGRRAFGSYSDGLSESGVDVVIVATPTVTHRDLALQALEAGKHVIVEKPAFMTSADATVICEAAGVAGRRAFVAENYAY